MNIVVEGSSDDDYSSLSSCSSLGENLDEFLNIIYKQKKFRVIDFKPYEQWRSQVLGFGGAKIPTWSSGRAEGTSFLGSPGAMLPW